MLSERSRQDGEPFVNGKYQVASRSMSRATAIKNAKSASVQGQNDQWSQYRNLSEPLIPRF